MINGGGDPEKSAIRITNSTITQCISGGDYSGANTGGAIRTYGTVKSSLYLTNVTMSYNYAMRETKEYNNTLEHDANGAALFWNGAGTSTTKCVIDGCAFQYNISEDNGGAIKAQGSIEFVNNKTTISNNQAPNGAGLYIEGYTGAALNGKLCKMNYDLNEFLEIADNTSPAYDYEGSHNPGKGAGVHFYFGSEMSLASNSIININMNGAMIQNNKTEGKGGMGGGLYIENSTTTAYDINVNLNYGTISKNESTGKGGGIYILNENVNSLNDENSGYELTIAQNKSTTQGGGIHIENGSFTMVGGHMLNNISNTMGGGISINGGNFSLQQGKINKNESPVAGGIYMDGGEFTMEDGEIEGNMATTGNGGGLYIENAGSFEMKNGTISGNTAKANGGGICMLDGEVTITDGSIQGNSSQAYGGGLYVYNSDAGTTNTASFSGGIILQNSATYGGGACVDGNIELAITKIQIDQNTAINGGGICLLNNAAMNFGEGLIRNNTAKAKTDGESFGTAKGAMIDKLHGVGGGIYLNDNTSLTFNSPETMGLYGNKADNAADDVFASGQGTKVTLPKVIYMNLTGYSAANGNLFWVEDYVAGDTEYSEGTYINNDKDYVAKRYRVALANSEQVYTVEDGNFDNKYLCLTLGFRVLYAIIKKVGLREGESAIFVVSKKKEDGEYSTYATILFKGETGKAELSKEITISAGTWQVEETDWSWGYKMKAGSSKVIVKENIEKDGEIFEFENEFDATGDKPLKYDEKIKVNVLQM